MTGEKAASIIKRVIEQEGGLPGGNLHSWRCEYPDTYGKDYPCTCVQDIADLIVARLTEAGFHI